MRDVEIACLCVDAPPALALVLEVAYVGRAPSVSYMEADGEHDRTFTLSLSLPLSTSLSLSLSTSLPLYLSLSHARVSGVPSFIQHVDQFYPHRTSRILQLASLL